MTAVLYLTRNGLLEPLGQSQVLAYLRGLASDYAITVVTFEKADDWNDVDRRKRVAAECLHYGIRWLPQKFYYHPRYLAATVSMLQMLWIAYREVRAGRAHLIHARSYLPTGVALLVHLVTKVPFIFDMRALWPEELITAGRLRRESLLHRALVAMERACLRRAAAVVSLTQAAVNYLRQRYPQEVEGKRIAVIPTCADLDRFKPVGKRKSGPFVHGCIGTVLSGWFRIDWLAAWFATVASEDPNAIFEVVTLDAPDRIWSALDPNGSLGSRLIVRSSLPEDMPSVVRAHDVSILFYAGGHVSELGRSPTRMAEVLGSGLPVVVNDGVGDVADIVRRHRVGVVVDSSDHEKMRQAYHQLLDLMADPDLSARCRQTAEAVFSLEKGTSAYRALYSSILNESCRWC